MTRTLTATSEHAGERLDSFLAAERPFLELLYPDNRAMTEELLMDIYKDAGFAK